MHEMFSCRLIQSYRSAPTRTGTRQNHWRSTLLLKAFPFPFSFSYRPWKPVIEIINLGILRIWSYALERKRARFVIRRRAKNHQLSHKSRTPSTRTVLLLVIQGPVGPGQKLKSWRLQWFRRKYCIRLFKQQTLNGPFRMAHTAVIA